MTIAILGAGGQLGHDLLEALAGRELVGLTRADLDVTASDQVEKVLNDLKPEAVINTTAFHQVDRCEEEVDTAFLVNTHAVRHLAKICATLDTVLVHISTDYVFDGRNETPYPEDARPNPLSVYGVSKLAGEQFVRNICPKHFVVRSSGLYGVKGASGKGGNFVETMLRAAKEGKALKVVEDQVLSPTYTRDLAEKIAELVETHEYGLYHITNSGHCSWYEFAAKIFELTGIEAELSAATTAEYGIIARRPEYSVLANEGLKRIRVGGLRQWSEALRAYLYEKGHLAGGNS